MAGYEKKEYKKYKTITCKVCGYSFNEFEFKKHVKEEKIRFCKEMGLNPKYYYEVKWNNVIKKFNPTNYRLYVKKEVQLNLRGRVVKDDVQGYVS